jgi:hypothetical protein
LGLGRDPRGSLRPAEARTRRCWLLDVIPTFDSTLLRDGGRILVVERRFGRLGWPRPRQRALRRRRELWDHCRQDCSLSARLRLRLSICTSGSTFARQRIGGSAPQHGPRGGARSAPRSRSNDGARARDRPPYSQPLLAPSYPCCATSFPSAVCLVLFFSFQKRIERSADRAREGGGAEAGAALGRGSAEARDRRRGSVRSNRTSSS